MRPFLAFIALLLPLSASADQITATLVGQTSSAYAELVLPYPGGSCYKIGVVSASCSLDGISIGAQVGANPLFGGGGLAVSATGAYGDSYSGGSSSASAIDSIAITGGSGAGYIEIEPGYLGPSTQISGASITVNGQPIREYGWTAVPFTFGQSVSFSLYAWSEDDLTIASLGDVRVYGYNPGCDYSSSCADPNYLDITSLFTPSSSGGGGVGSSISQVPEPASMWISGLGLLALVLFRRLASGLRARI